MCAHTCNRTVRHTFCTKTQHRNSFYKYVHISDRVHRFLHILSRFSSENLLQCVLFQNKFEKIYCFLQAAYLSTQMPNFSILSTCKLSRSLRLPLPPALNSFQMTAWWRVNLFYEIGALDFSHGETLALVSEATSPRFLKRCSHQSHFRLYLRRYHDCCIKSVHRVAKSRCVTRICNNTCVRKAKTVFRFDCVQNIPFVCSITSAQSIGYAGGDASAAVPPTHATSLEFVLVSIIIKVLPFVMLPAFDEIPALRHFLPGHPRRVLWRLMHLQWHLCWRCHLRSWFHRRPICC